MLSQEKISQRNMYVKSKPINIIGNLNYLDNLDTLDTLDKLDTLDTLDNLDTLNTLDNLDSLNTLDNLDTLDKYIFFYNEINITNSLEEKKKYNNINNTYKLDSICFDPTKSSPPDEWSIRLRNRIRNYDITSYRYINHLFDNK